MENKKFETASIISQKINKLKQEIDKVYLYKQRKQVGLGLHASLYGNNLIDYTNTFILMEDHLPMPLESFLDFYMQSCQTEINLLKEEFKNL